MTHSEPPDRDTPRSLSIPRDGPMRPPVKRFYRTAEAAAAPTGGGYCVLLDGRIARTPGKTQAILPSRALADAIAAEWSAQGDVIDPLTMPLMRLVNTATDAVAIRMEAVRADLVAFANSDLVCYRADHPAALGERQAAAWDPAVDWASATLGIRPHVTVGLMPVAQPPRLAEAIAARVAPLDALRLSALHTMTTLTGSLLLALGVLERAWSVETAWQAAHVDEDWQIAQWGEDAEAARRRRARLGDMLAAARLLELVER